MRFAARGDRFGTVSDFVCGIGHSMDTLLADLLVCTLDVWTWWLLR